MPIPLALLAVAAPMFLASKPDLVAEMGKTGLVGTFPALKQRSGDGLAGWLETIARGHPRPTEST